jgi:hypothetical protein
VPHQTNHGRTRDLAALLGAFPAALALALALGAIFPAPREYRLTVGAYAVFPLYAVLGVWLWLAPTGASAWRRVVACVVIGAGCFAVTRALRGGA